MSDALTRGRFLWHELSTTDTKGAAAFYQKAVGWTTQTWDQNPSYVMFAAGERPMAGLLALGGDGSKRPNWLTYIGTPDLEATTRQAQALGAKVIAPAEGVPAVGRWVVLQDPQGAVFAILQPSRPPGPDGESPLGDFSWHELATTDSQGAINFYGQLFGWEETGSMDMGPDLGMYYMFGRGGRPLGGIYKKPSDASAPAHMKTPPHWLPYVLVPDAHRAADATKKAGGQLANGPMEVPGGDWIAIGIDPQGSMFAVHSRKTAIPAVDRTSSARPAKGAKSVKKAAKTVAKKIAKKTAKKAAKKAPARAAKKTAKKAVRRVAKKTARRKTSRGGRSTTRVVRKSAAKSSARSTKRTAKKAVARKRTAKKASRRSRR